VQVLRDVEALVRLELNFIRKLYELQRFEIGEGREEGVKVERECKEGKLKKREIQKIGNSRNSVQKINRSGGEI
jgi:hypothetical protein